MSYLDLKAALMLQYNQMIACFIRMKVDGEDVSEHPILERLCHIKLMLEKLRPLDSKLDYQI